MNWIACILPILTVKHNGKTQTYYNTPINLDTCFTFKKHVFNMPDFGKENFYSIRFIRDRYTEDRWVFEDEKQQELQYTKLMQKIKY